VKPLFALPAEEARRLHGLLFDLDDTLLSHGLLTRVAYGALWDLHDAGMKLVAVTGRPSGWGEVMVRQWPIAGCVTENGAIHLVREGRGVTRWDACDELERRSRAIEEAGARWTRSSVHLHATYDKDDKASGTLRFLAQQLGEEAGAAVTRFAFVGDSGNDAACFAAFRTTFGVANVRAALRHLTVPPRYVADRSMGEGFAEVAAEILRKR